MNLHKQHILFPTVSTPDPSGWWCHLNLYRLYKWNCHLNLYRLCKWWFHLILYSLYKWNCKVLSMGNFGKLTFSCHYHTFSTWPLDCWQTWFRRFCRTYKEICTRQFLGKIILIHWFIIVWIILVIFSISCDNKLYLSPCITIYVELWEIFET